MPLLAAFFFCTAFLYASIGFAGGSTYTALLGIMDVDYRVIPLVSLCCNILVSAGGMWRFIISGHFDLKRFWPWIILSVPAAVLGGMLPVSKTIFYGILSVMLVIAGVKFLFFHGRNDSCKGEKNLSPILSVTGGAVLGLLAGITGIGGGIYLAPVLHFIRWGSAHKIAAACSFFIFINSLAGFLGQIIKFEDIAALAPIFEYWPLLPAVVAGGTAGSWLGAKRLPARWIIKGTGVLMLCASVQLLRKLFIQF